MKEYGCDVAQGYGIARPMPEPELRAWLRERQQHHEGVRSGEG